MSAIFVIFLKLVASGDKVKFVGLPHFERLFAKVGVGSDEVTIAPKLTIEHINVRHQDRQRVILFFEFQTV